MKKILIFMILLLPCCKKHWTAMHQTGYIVGPTNDIIQLDQKSESRVPDQAVNSSVLIATRLQDGGIKFCSGTLVESLTFNKGVRVLTNHHCFAETSDTGETSEAFLLESCTNSKVYFGFNKITINAGITPLPCKVGTLRSSFDFDLASFELGGVIPGGYKPLAIWPEDKEIPVNREALIVHYPDVEENLVKPEGEAAKLPLASLTIDNCQVLGVFDTQEWGLDHTLPYSIRHTCDLVHGSSGSALIDKETSTILGVNWGGIKIKYDQDVRTDNAATSYKYVRAFLSNEVEKARNEANSLRAEEDAKAQQQRKKPTSENKFMKTLQNIFCGTINLAGTGQAWAKQSLYGMAIILLMVPFVLIVLNVFIFNRKRKSTNAP